MVIIKTFSQINLFNTVIEDSLYAKENNDEIFEFLNKKYAHYMPYKNKYDEWTIKINKKTFLTFNKREPSEYSCEEFKNGFYSVGLEKGDYGRSCPTVKFDDACAVFEDNVRWAEING